MGVRSSHRFRATRDGCPGGTRHPTQPDWRDGAARFLRCAGVLLSADSPVAAEKREARPLLFADLPVFTKRGRASVRLAQAINVKRVRQQLIVPDAPGLPIARTPPKRCSG